MTKKRKNPAAVSLGRRGGKARSEAKTQAARANARLRWERVRVQQQERKS
jgi:hypothetical protein